MICDYTDTTREESAEDLFATLSTDQETKVIEFMKGLKETENRQRQRVYSNWIMESIIPLLKDFAQRTYSCLEVQEKKQSIYVLLKDDKTIDIAAPDELRNMKLALLLADYIEMNSDGEAVRLNLAYQMAEDNEIERL